MVNIIKSSLKTSMLYAICLALIINNCSKKKVETVEWVTGTIVFAVNGEDFVRQGFVDKQGWNISFDKLYINIANPVAYTPHGEMHVAALTGEHWIDLAHGDENANPIVVGKLENIKTGNYQSLKFKIKRVQSGEHKGFTIVMIGNASKDGKTVPFTIKLDEEMDCDGKEGFVGDEIKGMLKPGGSTTVEMTFHFDHIFGDKEASEDDHINTGSVGFDFFNRFSKDEKVTVAQSEMKSVQGYDTLVKAIRTLGHLGEGHCDVSNQSSAGSTK